MMRAGVYITTEAVCIHYGRVLYNFEVSTYCIITEVERIMVVASN